MFKPTLKVVLASLALFVGAAALTTPTLASGGGSGNSSSNRSEIRLEAKMRSGATEAKVAWRQETRGNSTKRKVEAEIFRGKPNTKYNVTHNGKLIATFTTNSLGAGRVEFERNVVAMKAGDVVTVGAYKGVLARR